MEGVHFNPMYFNASRCAMLPNKLRLITKKVLEILAFLETLNLEPARSQQRRDRLPQIISPKAAFLQAILQRSAKCAVQSHAVSFFLTQFQFVFFRKRIISIIRVKGKAEGFSFMFSVAVFFSCKM